MNLVYCITLIHHTKVYDISFGIKQKSRLYLLIKSWVKIVRSKAERSDNFLSIFLLIVNEMS